MTGYDWNNDLGGPEEPMPTGRKTEGEGIWAGFEITLDESSDGQSTPVPPTQTANLLVAEIVSSTPDETIPVPEPEGSAEGNSEPEPEIPAEDPFSDFAHLQKPENAKILSRIREIWGKTNLFDALVSKCESSSWFVSAETLAEIRTLAERQRTGD